MTFSIRCRFQVTDAAEMQQIYASVGWARHTEEIIRTIYRASSHVTIVQEGSRIIGFGRAMSDGVFNAAIYDVVVRPDYQGQGVGQQILADLLTQLKDISCVHLISTTGNERFYQRAGFRRTKTGMARYLNPQLAEQYLDA